MGTDGVSWRVKCGFQANFAILTHVVICVHDIVPAEGLFAQILRSSLF